MNKSDSINELAAALSAAQGELKHAPMNSVNPFLKNKYADLGSVIEAAKPVLAKHKLAVTQLVGGDGRLVSVETMMIHASGQWISETVSLVLADEKGKSDAQVAGSVITYLRRYALSAILGMYADEDTDGNKSTQTAHATSKSNGATKDGVSPALKGRWDTIVKEAKSAGVDMNFEITAEDNDSTLTERAKYIKAATQKALTRQADSVTEAH